MTAAFIIEKIVKFFGTPLGRWILIVAMIGMALFAGAAHERNVGYAEGIDVGAKQRAKEEEAYLKMVGGIQTGFNALKVKYDAMKAKAEADAKAAETKRLKDLAAQKERLTRDLPPAAVATCPYLPFGYLVHRYNAAQVARGADPRAPEPASESIAAAPGISITGTAALDDLQADSFRQCRERVKGWEDYVATLSAWRADANKIIQNATKGMQ